MLKKKAESFGAEGDYEPSFDSLEERIEWMEFAVNDKFLHQYEDDYSNVVLDIEEWNENNGNNSKLSNLVKQYKNKTGWMDAESFRSYKVAPDLSSYTKAELVSSIAGPQGTAAYDEVVYDPIAQSRLSAESIDSFSPARLMILGASIGVALGLYKTRGE
jgi:hypothetical protein